MSIEEAIISNMWEIAAIVELLEQKGVFLGTKSRSRTMASTSTGARLKT